MNVNTTKTVPATFKLPAELKFRLAEMAAVTNKNMTTIVCEALETHLAALPQHVEAARIQIIEQGEALKN